MLTIVALPALSMSSARLSTLCYFSQEIVSGFIGGVVDYVNSTRQQDPLNPHLFQNPAYLRREPSAHPECQAHIDKECSRYIGACGRLIAFRDELQNLLDEYDLPESKYLSG